MTATDPMRPCPVCGHADVRTSVRRERLPIFQNVVYPTEEAARAAPQAAFALATCARCGFSYNGAFRSELVVYDQNYDNAVPSRVFLDYYRSVARMLIDRFDLKDGKVFDVGCGKGEFLQILCELAPGIEGIGIDPSCTPVERGNFRLINAEFSAEHFQGETRLVILRHVLEHIDTPVDFLAALRAAAPTAPLYVEVPDLAWILENGAFWDFCYEHCNYFTLPSLAVAMQRAGYAVAAQQPAFGEQYQWVIGEPAAAVDASGDGDAAVAAVAAYSEHEAAKLGEMRALADTAEGVVVWGMATKGVILSLLLGEGRVRGGVDVNVAKQGHYAAGSGTAIHPPAWLADIGEGATALVMNPNYFDEIAATVEAMKAPVRLVAA